MRRNLKKINIDDLISETRLAEALDISQKTIKNRIARGEMPMPFRLPGSSRNYFLREEVEEWLGSVLERRPPIGRAGRGKRKADLVRERQAGLALARGRVDGQ